MIIGINAPALTHVRMSGSLDLLGDRLCELDMRSVRISLTWAAIEPKGNGKLNAQACARVDRALAALPGSAKPLGYLVHPSSTVAEDYFHDPSAMSERFARYCRLVAKRFPTITDWEIWNEPNASDFYLSVKTDNGARPWTPEEFVDHILLPGARAIKEVQPNATLCIGAMAEDGVVGHDDRPPALSNRLPKTAEYNKYRADGPHSHFYFIPEFWGDLTKILAARSNEILPLFHACAFHPYPYFRIHHRPDKTLLSATQKHCEDFFERYDAADLNGLEIWVTEYGARSLEVSGPHYNDEFQQSEFARASLEWMAQTQRIARGYWYKLIDLPWDLQQEKTFGLLDFRMMPRDVYHVVRKLAHQRHADLPKTRVLETFQIGQQKAGSGFAPDLWSVSADTIFGYTLVSQNASGAGECLVVPGRESGDKIQIDSKTALTVTKDQVASARVDLALPFGASPFDLNITLQGDGASDLTVTVALQDMVSVDVRQADALKEAAPDHTDWPVAKAEDLTRVDLMWSDTTLFLKLQFGDMLLHRSFQIKPIAYDAPLKLGITVERKGETPVFLSLKRLDLEVKAAPDLVDVSPRNLKGEEVWFLSLPRYSQIYQDNWVMQMLRFKTGGFFAEIGGHDGVENSNTLLLERMLGWHGMIVEANPRWHKVICQNRSAIAYNNAAFSESGGKLRFVDAGAIGGLVDFIHDDDIHAGKRNAAIEDGKVIEVYGRTVGEMLASASAPEVVDYMSVDTEGSEAEILSGVDFDTCRFALLTVEHGGIEQSRKDVWKVLETKGYIRHRVWFEDWFWHPTHLASALGVSEEEARDHAAHVFAQERYHRRQHLLGRAKTARDAGDLSVAATLSEEAGKAYHPDNVHGLADAVACYLEMNKQNRALQLCALALRRFPNHPRILRQSALCYAKFGREKKLASVMARISKHCPHLLQDESIARLA